MYFEHINWIAKQQIYISFLNQLFTYYRKPNILSVWYNIAKENGIIKLSVYHFVMYDVHKRSV